MRLACFVYIALLTTISQVSWAADHRVEKLEQAPPTEGVSPEILKQISPVGLKVIRGSSRTVCEIWPAAQWKATADFKPSTTILYPFQNGHLFGLIRYPRKAEDFRGQEIPAGLYTMRYALQPVDGNHVGTSDTRDFLLLIPVSEDTASDPLEEKNMFMLSTKTTGTAHPAMLSMMLPAKEGDTPSIRHQEDRDLWVARFDSNTDTEGKKKTLAVELVVVGHATE